MLNLGRGPLLVVANVVFLCTYGLHIHTVRSPQQLQKFVSFIVPLQKLVSFTVPLQKSVSFTVPCRNVSRSLPLRKFVTYIVCCTLAENGKLYYVLCPCRNWSASLCPVPLQCPVPFVVKFRFLTYVS